MTEEEYWYWLCNLEGMWQGKINKLIERFGHPREVYRANSNQILQVDGINESDLKKLMVSKKKNNTLNELEKLKKNEISFIHFGHRDYPSKFLMMQDKPFSLFVKGQLPDSKKPIIAMIGARECSSYGKEMARYISEQLVKYDIQIISGMARGIDSYSQWGAIDNGGMCFGVLGCGVDICYPKENIELFCLTCKNGGIISEYPLGSKPLAWRFPHRNRLISGFADKLIIIEAKEKSGTLITVEHALDQGKDVYALPGRFTDAMSVGCNKLIKDGAQILTDVHDLLDNSWIISEKIDKIYNKADNSLEKDFEVVYSCVDFTPKNLQQIIEESQLNSREVLRILVELEIKELVVESTKNFYSKKV